MVRPAEFMAYTGSAEVAPADTSQLSGLAILIPPRWTNKYTEYNVAYATGIKEVPVTTVRKLFLLAAAFGLFASGSAFAETKGSAKPMSQVENQKLADSVAAKLKGSGVTKGSKVAIETRDGVVDLSGTVTSETQRDEIHRVLMTVPGLRRIESSLSVMETTPKTPAAPAVTAAIVPAVPAVKPATPVMQMPQTAPLARVNADEPAILRNAPTGGGSGSGIVAEPVPLNGNIAIAPVDPAGPNMPAYAWPTYAPHNNYSRVAYPSAYPYNAFPYIGPFYPFPKVPLGWRKVVLEWDDGHWYMGRITPPHDMWRVRFW